MGSFVGAQVATFSKGSTTTRVVAHVRLFSRVNSLVNFKGAGPQKSPAAFWTFKRPFIVMFSKMVFEMSSGGKTTAAFRELAFIRTFSCMNPQMGLQVALFTECFFTIFVRTYIRFLASLYAISLHLLHLVKVRDSEDGYWGDLYGKIAVDSIGKYEQLFVFGLASWRVRTEPLWRLRLATERKWTGVGLWKIEEAENFGYVPLRVRGVLLYYYVDVKLSQ